MRIYRNAGQDSLIIGESIIWILSTFFLFLVSTAGLILSVIEVFFKKTEGMSLFLYGVFFFLITAGAFFSSRWFKFDRQKRKLTIFGLFGMKSAELSFSSFSFVSVERVRRVSRGRYRSEYYVYNAVLHGNKSFDLGDFRVYMDSRGISEIVAGCVGCNMVDKTCSPPLTRKPEELDETVAERAVRKKEIIKRYPKPALIKSEIKQTDSSIAIHVKMQLVNPLLKIVFLSSAAALFLSVGFYYSEPTLVRKFFMLIFLGCSATTIAFINKGQKIYLDHKALTVTEMVIIPVWHTRIPLSELEEFEVNFERSIFGVTRIMARSDRSMINICYGIEVSEMRWLFTEMKAIIVESLVGTGNLITEEQVDETAENKNVHENVTLL